MKFSIRDLFSKCNQIYSVLYLLQFPVFVVYIFDKESTIFKYGWVFPPKLLERLIEGFVFESVNLLDGFSIFQIATKDILRSSWIIFLHYKLISASIILLRTRKFWNTFPTT